RQAGRKATGIIKSGGCKKGTGEIENRLDAVDDQLVGTRPGDRPPTCAFVVIRADHGPPLYKLDERSLWYRQLLV
ncbi:hypothetical protein ABTZ89_08320, partial [Saccharopolyspora sp. NPDC002686]